MEKKTSQRIIGVLVVIALVIVLLPLLFGGNEATETAAIKAPPFPDQQNQQPSGTDPATLAAQNANDQTINPNQPMPAETTSQNTVSPGPSPAQTASQNTVPPSTDPMPAQTASQNTVSPAADSLPAQTALQSTGPMPAAENTNPTTQTVNVEKNVSVVTEGVSPASPPSQVEPVVEKIAATNPSSLQEKVNAPAVKQDQLSKKDPTDLIVDKNQNILVPKEEDEVADSDGSAVTKNNSPSKTDSVLKQSKYTKTHSQPAKIKTAGWVVQLGSFKNKSNAIRLTQSLRAAGFKAFTHEVNSAMRVFVGPMNKQTSALALVSKLQQQTHIHGIVLNYQPFALG